MPHQILLRSCKWEHEQTFKQIDGLPLTAFARCTEEKYPWSPNFSEIRIRCYSLHQLHRIPFDTWFTHIGVGEKGRGLAECLLLMLKCEMAWLLSSLILISI